MPRVNITAATATRNTVARRDIKGGCLFRKSLRSGLGDITYAAIGHNGKCLSINTSNGALASSDNDDAPCVIVGSFHYTTEMYTAPIRVCRRSQVKTTEIFRVKGGSSLYMHLGVLNQTNGDNKWASLRVDGDLLEDYASTRKDSNVEIVGTYTIAGQRVA